MQNMRVTIEAMAGGPLLPPQALLEYETILPGAAERLLALHEKQVAHQQDLKMPNTVAGTGDWNCKRASHSAVTALVTPLLPWGWCWHSPLT